MNDTRPVHVPTLTPWGPSQSSEEIAPGLTWHNTMSHGGLELSPARWTDLTIAFPVTPWAGEGWLEEDCDAALAIIRWPDLFDACAVFHALRQVNHGGSPNYDAAVQWLHDACGVARMTIAKANQFAHAMRNHWERGSMHSTEGGWFIHFTRGDQDQWRKFTAYPQDWFYTDTELNAAAEPKETVDA